MKRWLATALMLFLPWVAQAEISFARIAQLALAPAVMAGSFNQEKYLASLDATLASNGIFTYQRGKSLRWEILQPIKNELLITPDSIRNRQGDQELMSLDSENNPATRTIAAIFFAVLTADWEKLEPYFELSGSIDEQRWQVILLPTDEVVAQVFSRIELKGEKLLEQVLLFESSGDRTLINLVNQG